LSVGVRIGAASDGRTGGFLAACTQRIRALARRAETYRDQSSQSSQSMSKQQPSREVLTPDHSEAEFSPDERCIALSALWVWRAQLGRVGSDVPIPGMGTEEYRLKVNGIAQKLGGDPDAYFFGLDLPQRH
jgi:hypothetical protein